MLFLFEPDLKGEIGFGLTEIEKGRVKTGGGNTIKNISKDAEGLKAKEQSSFLWPGQSVSEELQSRGGC